VSISWVVLTLIKGIYGLISSSSIDGVLLRSSRPIPGASQTLSYLQHQHIPFILLTNGGGKHESDRVSDLSTSLSLATPLTTNNFIQSHTPIADFLQTFPDHPSGDGLPAESTILVLGGEANNCRSVAESYGFRNVVTPADILTAHPEMWPFSHVFSGYYSRFAQPLVRPINPSSPSSSLKIDAIFVFNDPRDWALDIQLILDILLSNSGILGTVSERNGDKSLPNDGYQQHDQPPLYFSNPDLLWAASYHLPRLGQGGFIHALEGVWHRITHGAKLQSTVLGKPSRLTYEFAEKRLRSHRRDLLTESGRAGENGELRKVYMVGDNPESDVMGANLYHSPHGTEWVSILVKTGVFREGDDGGHYDFNTRPELRPKVILDDVQKAVMWALKDMGWAAKMGVH
jgi:HAD superfamily hydrolase (TIGR01456 family)